MVVELTTNAALLLLLLLLLLCSARRLQQHTSTDPDDKNKASIVSGDAEEEEEDEERKKENMEEDVLLNDDDKEGENDDGLALLRKLRDERRFRYQSSATDASSTFLENCNNCGGGIEESKALYIALEESKKLPEFMRMLEIRMKLPAWSYKDEILMLLKENQVLVLSGDTGCGKSTQVPQFILEESINALEGAACNIICTEPRKISAVGLAERVAVERYEKGGAGSEMGLVGYQVRLEKRATRRTRLLYCTVGILLRRLVFDQNLEDVSHVIVDEAHERQADMDFLLVLLRELRSRRSDIKIIIMSATIKEKDFSKYFGGVPCLTISEGKRFPVEILYLEEVWKVLRKGKKMNKVVREQSISQAERQRRPPHFSNDEEAAAGLPPPSEPVDQELVLDLIKYIVLYSNEGRRSTGGGGGILCFLSGFSDIDKLLRSIRAEPALDAICHSLGLHSSLSLQDQRSAFRPPPSPKTWKVVASTNVAEASITIPDITHVIDSGRVKELGHNPMTGLSSLVEVWGSQASAKQRSGRAGRVGPGTCWRLYPRLMENRMLPYNIPEILRVPLEDLLLQGIVLNAEPPESDVVSAGGIGEGISSTDPREILSKAMEPPTQIALDMALHNLVQLQACRIANHSLDHFRPVSSAPPCYPPYPDSAAASADTSADDIVAVHLTPLGFYLSQLPVPCRVGKLLIMGVLFECLDPILTVAAEMSSKPPFLKPFGALSAASKAHATFEREADARSDHLAVIYAYEAWLGCGNDRARRSWCRQNYVGMEAMNTIRGLRSQFTHHLAAAGFIEMEDDLPSINSSPEGGNSTTALPLPKHSTRKGDKALLRCVLCSGLMPRMASFVRGKSPHFITAHDNCVAVHPGSVNHAVFQQAAVTGKNIFVVYHSKVRTTRTYMHDTTLVTPFSLLLWGGGSGGGARHLRRGDIESEKRSSTTGSSKVKKGNIVIELDSWLRFQADEEVAVIFKHLRTIVNTALLERMLPKSDEVGSKGGEGGQIPLSVPECVTRLLRIEERG